MGTEEALERFRAVELLHLAASAEVNGPGARVKELVAQAEEHFTASIQPLIDDELLYNHEWFVKNRVEDLRGVGPKPFERRQAEVKHLKRQFPDVIGELAIGAASMQN